MALVYIGVGSNVGDRYKNIENARRLLEEGGLQINKASPLYETEALCKPGQSMAAFVNGVFEVTTDLDPKELLKKLESVEQAMGRHQKSNWQPRVIDLDILSYGSQIIDREFLKIPHPEMHYRWFVLKPLFDIAPEWKHPRIKKTTKELLAEIETKI